MATLKSRNKPAITALERRHVQRVKMLGCSVCDDPRQCEAHEIKQGSWFLSIALCPSCHRDVKMGIHGEKLMWRIKKMDELDALNITLQRLDGR